MTIHLDGDGCWPDLADRGVRDHPVHSVAALPRGTESGLPSVAVRIDMDDGSTVIAQTTMRLFLAAARAFAARYPEATE